MKKILLTLTALICMNAHSKMVKVKFNYSQEQENGAPIIRIKPNRVTERLTDSKKAIEREFFGSIESKLQILEKTKARIFGEENLEKLEESFQRFKKDGGLLYFSIRDLKENRTVAPPKSHQLTFIGRDLPYLDPLPPQIREVFKEYAKRKDKKMFDEYLAFYDFISLLWKLEAQTGYYLEY